MGLRDFFYYIYSSRINFHTSDEGNMESIDVVIKYEGIEVEDGTISLIELVPALQGFAGAYSEIVKYYNLPGKHEVRVKAIQKGGFELILKALSDIDPEILKFLGFEVSVPLSFKIIGLIGKLFEYLKHIQGQQPQVKIEGDGNNVVVINNNGEKQTFPIDLFKIAKESDVVKDISKMAIPIKKGEIDSLSISAKDRKGNEIEMGIDYKEKIYFESDADNEIEHKHGHFIGTINTMTKSTNNGRIILTDSSNVPFHLSMSNPNKYYKFFDHRGLVRVEGVGHYKNNEQLIGMDIYSIEEFQMNIQDLESKNNSDET